MRILRRLAVWWRFRARGAELEEELSFHREAIERDLIARGYSPDDARTAARRRMGNEMLMREESRGVWLWPWLEGVWQDARGTVRGLLKSPVFTAGVMLTFALGVGANTAMFSLIDRLIFRPPPLLRESASVHRVYLYETERGVERGMTGGPYARHAISRAGRHRSPMLQRSLPGSLRLVSARTHVRCVLVSSVRASSASSMHRPRLAGISPRRKTRRPWAPP